MYTDGAVSYPYDIIIDNIRLSVYSLLGEEITCLKPGIYILQVETRDNRRISSKVIKQ